MCRLFRPRKYRVQNKRPNFLEEFIEKTDLGGIKKLIVNLIIDMRKNLMPKSGFCSLVGRCEL